MKRVRTNQSGLSLVEMMASVSVFMMLAGAAFGLLITAQQRQRTESELLDSFQAARLSLDEVVRDVSDAGYPPPNFFSVTPPANLVATTPFAWSPNPGSPCLVNISCITPGPYDLIIETDIDPQNGNGVEWVRYQLQGTTLYRGVFAKTPGADPATATQDPTVLVPYVENVVNNPPAGVLAQLQAQHPTMFPNGQPVPVFSYSFDPNAAAHTPGSILNVNITLIVMAKQPDTRTGQIRVAELQGGARRLNLGQ